MDDNNDAHLGKPGQSASGKNHGYSVEARLNTYKPDEVLGNILDNRWRRLNFPESHIGVPLHRKGELGLGELGLVSYAAAQALRWWFHAEAENSRKGICLETRIILHEVTFSYAETPKSVHEAIGGNDRSNIMPDWKAQKTRQIAPPGQSTGE